MRPLSMTPWRALLHCWVDLPSAGDVCDQGDAGVVDVVGDGSEHLLLRACGFRPPTAEHAFAESFVDLSDADEGVIELDSIAALGVADLPDLAAVGLQQVRRAARRTDHCGGCVVCPGDALVECWLEERDLGLCVVER